MILMTILIMNAGGKTGKIVPPQNKTNTVTEDSNKPVYACSDQNFCYVFYKLLNTYTIITLAADSDQP